MSDFQAKIKNAERALPTPQEWGPHVWYTMDLFVKGYGDHPDKALRQAAAQFFHSLGELLPCPHCREHYKYLLKQKPLRTALQNSKTLTKWVDWVKIEVEQIVKQKILEEQQKHRAVLLEEQQKHRAVLPIVIEPPRLHPIPELHQPPVAAAKSPGVPAQQKPLGLTNSRKRNFGKVRHIPRAHLIGGNPGSVTQNRAAPAAPKSKAAPSNSNKALNYNQRTAANIAANWKGSQAGLQRYIKSEKNYRRPCACN